MDLVGMLIELFKEMAVTIAVGAVEPADDDGFGAFDKLLELGAGEHEHDTRTHCSRKPHGFGAKVVRPRRDDD